MGDVVPLRQPEYVAAAFRSGPFVMSGTLCGGVDFTDGVSGTWCLTIAELDNLITALRLVRADVVENSRPYTDPRLI